MVRTILIKNDVFTDKAFYFDKVKCHSHNVDMCNKCRLRFQCFTIRKTNISNIAMNGDLTVRLSDIFKVNKEHKNKVEINCMLEEYMFGHLLNLSESAMVAIW